MKVDINKNHLIVGFGATGRSIAKALSFIGVKNIWAIDSRKHSPYEYEMQTLCARYALGGFDHELLVECDYLWLSPGIPLSTPELQTVLTRLPEEHIGGDIELFARLVKGRVIGITGTNGKSTVTTLIADMFRTAGYTTYVGGNLGEPALSLWLKAEKERKDNPVFVLELSSFQLETTSHLEMDVGVILNIAPDHLDRYPSIEAYAAAKFKLFDQAKNWVSNADDLILTNYIKRSYKDCLGVIATFSIESDVISDWTLVPSDKGDFVVHGADRIPVNTIPMGGRHNIANVMAASAVATLGKVGFSSIQQAILNYQALPHRCILVRTVNGVRYYNDSKATNLPSTEAAIKGFLEPKWLILGGLTKNQDFSSLESILDQSIKKIFLIGVDVRPIIDAIPQHIPYIYVGVLDQAVQAISEEAVDGDIVLFSPACASMDQFKDYNERGERFIEYVQALK